jgi:hypothetical protein
MTNTLKKICNIEDCKTPVNHKEGGIKGRCSRHGGYPLCNIEDCKTPVNHIEGGIKGRCSRHGGYPLCNIEDCKTPVKYREGGIKGRCRKHGGFPLCNYEKGCDIPVNHIEGGIKGRCKKHGGFPLCNVEDCKTPVNHKEGGIKGRCSRHGGFPLCNYEKGCDTPVAYKTGGIKGRCSRHGGYPFCVLCKYYTVNKEGIKCSTCDPIKREKRKKRQKTKENQIAKMLDKNDIKYERECYIKFNCYDIKNNDTTYCKIDFVIYTSNKIIILEVDEDQHKYGYKVTCENRRISAILGAQIYNGNDVQTTIVIRYNPDKFIKNAITQSVPQKKRQNKLLSIITNYTPKKNIEIHYMYYDQDDLGIPLITKESDYHPELKKCIVNDII